MLPCFHPKEITKTTDPITTAIQIPLYPPWDINKSRNPPIAGAESKHKNLDGYSEMACQLETSNTSCRGYSKTTE
jgi:hypothetical protein